MTLPSTDILLMAGRAVFLLFSFILAAIAFIAWRRATLSQTQQILAHSDRVLQRLADLEARVDAANHSVAALGERVQRPAHSPAAAADLAPGYRVAIRLAKSGASPEELVSECGLSHGEAELVKRLHGPGSAGWVTFS